MFRGWIKKKKFIYRLKKKGCVIHKSIELREEEFISIETPVFIGSGCKLLCWGNYTSGEKKQKLAPNLSIGQNFHATRNFVCQCAGKLSIGRDVLIASDVFIIDFNHGTLPHSDNYLSNNLEVKDIRIGDGVWIGNSVIILPGVSIGKKSIIAAGSVVTHSVPAYCMAAGNPARIIKKYDFEKEEWIRI